MATRVRSFSKINLGLAVGPARRDGFHALATCYQTVAAHDVVTVRAKPAAATRITLKANHPGVPRTETGDAEKNTAFRMVAAVLEHLKIAAEVEIEIDKRLPVQGGLGAGSANAAAALIGLERELELRLPGSEALELAARVGSDVPLFLLGGTVLGLGRGEEVYPLPDLPAMPCVLAVPPVGVSTAAAFRELDARMAGVSSSKSENSLIASAAATSTSRAADSLTSPAIMDRLEQLSRALSAAWVTGGAAVARGQDPNATREPSPSGISRWSADLAENALLALVRTGIENDFEEVVFLEHPSLRSTKRDLVGSDEVPEGRRALYAALSGSGSALFGLYRRQADAEAAQQRVRQSGTQAILTETLPRSEYWHRLMEPVE